MSAGKTTLLRALAGTLPASKTCTITGEVQYGGVALSALAAAPHNLDVHNLGVFVASEDVHHVELTPHETLIFAWNVSHRGGLASNDAAVTAAGDVTALLDMFLLSDVQHKRVAALSSTQRKLLSIAEAVVRTPKVLCIDNAFQGMTNTEAAQLVKSLHRWTALTNGVVITSGEAVPPSILQGINTLTLLSLGRFVFACTHTCAHACLHVHMLRAHPHFAHTVRVCCVRRCSVIFSAHARHLTLFLRSAGYACPLPHTTLPELCIMISQAPVETRLRYPVGASATAPSLPLPAIDSVEQLASHFQSVQASLSDAPSLSPHSRRALPALPSPVWSTASVESPSASLAPTPGNDAAASWVTEMQAKETFSLRNASAGGFAAFRWHWWRMVRVTLRNRAFFMPKAILGIVMGLILGSLYFKPVLTNFSPKVSLATYLCVMLAASTFGELPHHVHIGNVMKKHRERRWYSGFSYSPALCFSTIPHSILGSLILSLFIFFMVGYANDTPARFFWFWFCGFLVDIGCGALFRFYGTYRFLCCRPPPLRTHTST
ncbi:MAG: ATP-binding cassette domain-containing protein, partial [Methanosarcinales archaeon]